MSRSFGASIPIVGDTLDDVSGALHWLVDQHGELRLCPARDAGPPRAARVADASGHEVVVAALPVPDGAVELALDTAAVTRAAAKPLEEVLNHVAHDVRNLAFTAGLQAEMGARKSAASPDVRAHFEAVLRQVDALKVYLDRLLLVGRPVQLKLSEVDVGPLLRQVVARAQQARASQGPPLPLETEAEGAGVARWDAGAVALALGAAVDNAMESREPPPRTVISARGHENRVLLQVRDEGPGIAPELIPRLGAPMAVRRPGAAGLGLAIAQKMVHAHGGDMAVDSSPSGTTVTFTLPREVPGG